IAERLTAYPGVRDRMDLEGTASLSPYLRFGMLSAREAFARGVVALREQGASEQTIRDQAWFNELIWRDFFAMILYHFPYVRGAAFRQPLAGILWRNDEQHFAAWCAGRTGVPVVDAGMRQLAETGWMHNRARMITASYLVKNLLIDWRWGE